MIILLFSIIFSISQSCINDSDCIDSRFCNGLETCQGGLCVGGLYKCPGLGCNESLKVCAKAQRNNNLSFWHFTIDPIYEFQLFIDTDNNLSNNYEGYEIIFRGVFNDFGYIRKAYPGNINNPGGWGSIVTMGLSMRTGNDMRFFIPINYGNYRWKLETYNNGTIQTTTTGTGLSFNSLLTTRFDFFGN